MNNGTLLPVKVKDRRVFQMLSSVHSVNNVEIGCNDHESVRPITKPEIVHEYNMYMGAVNDQVRSNGFLFLFFGDAP